MTYQVTSGADVIVTGQPVSDVLSTDSRFSPAMESVKDDPYLAALYATLKEKWASNPDMSSKEIIDQLRQFVAADGTTPYQSLRTHTTTLDKIGKMLKEDGEESLPIYDRVRNGVGFSVVSNGILDSFISKMSERPEKAEDW